MCYSPGEAVGPGPAGARFRRFRAFSLPALVDKFWTDVI